MPHQISSKDLKSLRNFTPGIWDARAVHESLTELAERTGAIAFDGKRWDWTGVGHTFMHASLETLSPNALRVLVALLDASESKGYAFGLLRDACACSDLGSRVFDEHVPYVEHWIAWTEHLGNAVQYGLTESCLAARDEITALAAASAPAVAAPSLEHDLRSMVVRLEATAQLCGDGGYGLAAKLRAVAHVQSAAKLRALLKKHGHDCAPCKVYSSEEAEALAALTKAGGRASLKIVSCILRIPARI